MSKLDELKEQIVESPIWRSMFRHGYEDTPRNRVLMVSGNIWLHLHPSKVRKHGMRLKFTWCMGGITFFLFLVETVTGVSSAVETVSAAVTGASFAAVTFTETVAAEAPPWPSLAV